MNALESFPVGGPREPVYSFLKSHGFRMSKHSDKEWAWGDSATLLLYGSGSMATIYTNKGNFKGPLREAVEAMLAKEEFTQYEIKELADRL